MAFFKSWFFTHSQKLGIVGLFALILVVSGVFAGLNLHRRSTFRAAAFPDSLVSVRQVTEPQIIDINLADSAQWGSLPGIGPAFARRIVKYRKALGGFSDIGQIADVYGLPPETFEALLPWLKLDPATAPKETEHQTRAPRESREIPRLDINTASATDFEQLPGIGPTFSKRMIAYREAMGGYREVAQIRKIYGLPPETFAAIEPYLYTDPATLPAPKKSFDNQTFADKNIALESQENMRTRGLAPADEAPAFTKKNPVAVLDLNQADSAQFAQIPGIGEKTASRIVKFRTILGYYASVEQLRAVYGMSEENFQRMVPWLRVSDVSGYPRKDLNTAALRQLSILPRVGKPLAEALLQWRKELGRFENWKEVGETPGITAEALQELKAYFEVK
ncbi:MAG: helix-hairpin-helix domain-containing protein [Bacteroidetes bacterium]|nr:MAG: helix-hairpin-helix domain-containing protein [Bacteroidota bacterium]